MTYRIDFEVDDGLVKSVIDQLLECNIKPTTKVVRAVIRSALAWAGSSFINEPILFGDETEKESFIKDWL